jgi:uncharacterized protein (TIGR00297 family)
MGVGVLALGLVFLGPWGGVAIAAGLLVFNLWIFPRLGGRRLWRLDELARGASLGMPYYTLALLVVALLFHRHPEVVAATWGLLAFGDGAATLVGLGLGRRPLPWNPHKTWLGSLAYFLAGGVAAGLLLLWTKHHSGGDTPPAFLLTVAGIAALFSAFLESLPQKLDDNLWVPPLTALLLWCLLATEGTLGGGPPPSLAEAFFDGSRGMGIIAVILFLMGVVRFSGAVVGALLVTPFWVGLGAEGVLLFASFFVPATLASALGSREKAEFRRPGESGVRRGARNALANVGVASLAAFFAATTPYTAAFTLAFAGSLSAALGDTLASEIGQLARHPPRLLTTLEPVPTGTDGAISPLGTAVGLVGSVVLAIAGWKWGLYGAEGILVVAVAGFFGNLVDSLLGATLERRGQLDNEGVNFFNTLAAGLLAAGLGG